MGTAERFKRLEVQVLVVGAGPTGLTAANLLGRAGIETLVIERNESTTELYGRHHPDFLLDAREALG